MIFRWLIGGWLVGMGLLILAREFGLIETLSLPVIAALTMILIGVATLVSGMSDDPDGDR